MNAHTHARTHTDSHTHARTRAHTHTHQSHIRAIRAPIAIYLSLHCHHLNDSCIKMGSNESHFNVSLIARDQATRQCQ